MLNQVKLQTRLPDLMVKGNRTKLSLRCCRRINGGSGATEGGTFEEEEMLVKKMREAQPFFVAHRGCTFVVMVSSEIIDSTNLSSILEVPLWLWATLNY